MTWPAGASPTTHESHYRNGRDFWRGRIITQAGIPRVLWECNHTHKDRASAQECADFAMRTPTGEEASR